MLGSLIVLFGPFLVLVAAAVLRGWLDALADPEMRAFLGQYWWAIAFAVVRLRPAGILLAVRDPTLSLLLACCSARRYCARRLAAARTGSCSGPRARSCSSAPGRLLLGTELLFLRETFGTA